MRFHHLLIFSSMFTTAVATQADDLSNLPDPLTALDGSKVGTVEEWRGVRRAEILEMFRTHVYGRAPVGRPKGQAFVVVDVDPNAMEGAATRKRVEIHFSGPGGEGQLNLLIFVPNKIEHPAPGFLLICNRSRKNIDPDRIERDDFWPAEEIVARGYVAATFHNSDLDPDEDDGFQNGVHGIYDQGQRSGDSWATIAGWAWGASRVMDYFEIDPDIDEEHVAVVGHSRGGKTSLWAGAEDERFALVISNDSGCTGAALARRKVGETVEKINTVFPHWFCQNYKQYNDREEDLPVDQHMLIALMAPRPVYVASASLDKWADPEGEFLSCVYASPVYELFGYRGLGSQEMPPVERPIQSGYVGYHLREGKHDLTLYDWSRYMDFADKHWNLLETNNDES